MNHFITQLVHEVSVPASEVGARLLREALFFFLGVSCLLVSAGFLTVSLFDYLQPLIGNADDALVLGGLYLGAALIFIFVLRARRGRPQQDARTAIPAIKDKESLSSQKALLAKNIDETLAPLLDILREAGMERERVALLAGGEIVKQLRPFSLIALALAVGLIATRIFSRPVSPRK
jgi:hypothetical protein